MALTIEWKNRVDAWRKELPNHFYTRLGAVEFAGFTTHDRLSVEAAASGPFRPMPPGTAWGRKWQYGWFKAEVVLPAAAAGKHVVLHPNVGGEGLIFIGGKVAGARDWGRAYHTLARSAKAGARYAVIIEAYAGHGPTPCSIGPAPPERPTVPEPPPAQQQVCDSSFGVWEDDAFALWVEVETLHQLRECLDANSLRAAEIDRALRDFTTIVDFEVPRGERLATFRAARRRLRPLLKCVNGSTAPEMFAYGHGHLDVAWLWPLAETDRKAARTFANQLNLIAEYPGYRFLQSQPYLYRVVKRLYPELYERTRRAVRAGRFVPEGGMWVEADTNLSGGEALIRQFIHGTRFFRDEFGVRCRMLWLPDVFGYCGALPQILRGCGIRYFSTAKIFWNYNGGAPFPHSTFIWEGIDGSEVLAHLLVSYGGGTGPREVVGRWNHRPQKDGFSTMMYAFGHGDGGGGPTREHLEFLARERDLEGMPRMRMAGPVEYFKDQEARGWPQVRYVGELYYQAHRGTYTSQARIKRGNRKSELALREAEMWGTVAAAMGRFKYPAAAMDEAWKTLLLCQFHDILPGSSIARVCQEAEAMHAEVQRQAGEATAAATTALARRGDALTVFNSLGHERSALVPLPRGWTCAADARGRCLPQQTVEGARMVEVALPSCGWTSIKPCRRAGRSSKGGPKCRPGRGADPVRASKAGPGKFLLENGLIRVELGAAGQITSLFDKQQGRELAAGPCNVLRMYKDVPAQHDAWDIDSQYVLTPVELGARAEARIVAAGPLVAVIRVSRRIGKSDLVQGVSLRAGSRRIDFATTVEWRERHRMLKAAFPVAIHADEAIHEIQFGHVRRPNHQSRPFDADRFEVCNHKWTALAEAGRGAAVLNDCKYGVNVVGNTMNLTLLRSPVGPDAGADRGTQVFTYSLLTWAGCLVRAEVVREAYDLNVPATTARGAARTASVFAVDAPNVIIEAVKPAEDGSGDVVLRLYEAARTATRATLSTSLKVRAAVETDMLENPKGRLAVKAGKVALDLRPFEIKTLRLEL
jgi:alpha-mannosidase